MHEPGPFEVAAEYVGVWGVPEGYYSRVASAAELAGDKELTGIGSGAFFFCHEGA